MNNVFLDIESIPCQDPAYREAVRQNLKPPGNIKKADSIAAWLAENGDAAVDEAVAKTSFDPAHGHICTVGFALGDGEAVALHAETIEQEAGIIQSFYDALPAMGLVKIIGHNVSAFDLRFILCRSIVLGIEIPRCVPRDIKPWSEGVFDTMIAWAGVRGTIGQDRLAKALGMEGKGDFDGSMVAEAWANGEHEKIKEYCKRDVETVRAIYNRFEQVNF